MNHSQFNFKVATYGLILVVTLLCYLGFWQLSRAKFKEKNLLAYTQSSPEFLNAQDLLKNRDLFTNYRYKRVALKGNFMIENEKTILLDNKTDQGRVGYHVYVPVALDEKNVILVNRGWISLGKSRQILPSIAPIPQGVSIEGYLDKVNLNRFIRNTPESESWPLRVQQIDLNLLENQIGKKLYPLVLNLNEHSPGAFKVSPFSQGVTPERHRGYAFQWFALAFTFIVLYLYAFFSNKSFKKRGSHGNS